MITSIAYKSGLVVIIGSTMHFSLSNGFLKCSALWLQSDVRNSHFLLYSFHWFHKFVRIGCLKEKLAETLGSNSHSSSSFSFRSNSSSASIFFFMFSLFPFFFSFFFFFFFCFEVLKYYILKRKENRGHLHYNAFSKWHFVVQSFKVLRLAIHSVGLITFSFGQIIFLLFGHHSGFCSEKGSGYSEPGNWCYISAVISSCLAMKTSFIDSSEEIPLRILKTK